MSINNSIFNNLYGTDDKSLIIKYLKNIFGHALFYGPILAINQPLTMTFASTNSYFAVY